MSRLNTQNGYVYYAIITGILWIFGSFMCIYYVCQYWILKYKQKEQSCMKRHSILMDICWILFSLSYLIIQMLYLDYNFTKYIAIFAGLMFVSSILALIILAEQFWVLYYEINFNNDTHTESWQTLINHNISKSWFILNKNKYGNRFYIRKRLIIISVILCALLLSILGISFIAPHIRTVIIYISVLLICLFGGIIAIVLCVLYYKLKNYDDTFKMIKQAKMLVKILLLFCFFHG